MGLVSCSSSSPSNSDSAVIPSSAITVDAIAIDENNDGSTLNQVDVVDSETSANQAVELMEEIGDAQIVNDAQNLSNEPETALTQVEFKITVPEYQSEALQVKLKWGNVELSGVWNTDELWTVQAELPANTQHALLISFNDRNDGITLGRVEKDFKTGIEDSEVVVVSADEFNTSQWDADGDGVSNLDEFIAGSIPDGGELPQLVQASIAPRPIKTFQVSWNVAPDAQFHRVLENPDGLSGFNDISGELSAGTAEYDHNVSLYDRVNAHYLVQSCNEQGSGFHTLGTNV